MTASARWLDFRKWVLSMQDFSRTAAETMAILSEMKADLPDSALGTPSWSRLGKLEDLLMRLLAQSDSAWSEDGSHRHSN